MQHLQEDGSYNQLYPKVDSYSKSETLTNNTSQMFRIDNGTPEDVMQYLGKYAQYWWKKRKSAGETYLQSTEAYSVTIWTTGSVTLNISTDISFDTTTGTVTQINSYQLTLSNSDPNAAEMLMSQLIAKAPCYVSGCIGEPSVIMYLPSGATQGTSRHNATITTEYERASFNSSRSPTPMKYFGKKVATPVGEWEYIQSNERNAYPDTGSLDGHDYEFLRIPFEKLPEASTVEVGSYIGTGNSNENNQITLKFNFQPYRIILFYGSSYSSSTYHINMLNLIYPEVYGDYVNSSLNYYVSVAWGDKQISWFEHGTAKYFNELNQKYYYIAFGR